MPLSAHERQQLDLLSAPGRVALLQTISECAPVERRLRRYDWAAFGVGLAAIGLCVFVAFRGAELFGGGLAAVNALIFWGQWQRAHQRRAEWAWMREVGDYLLADEPASLFDRRQ